MSNFSLYRNKAFYSDLSLLENSRNRVTFIKSIESIVRSSPEYRNFISYLKNEAKLNYCSLMGNLSEEYLKKISIEMHHYPITLFDLVETVLLKALKEEKDFTKFSIANEVMESHFNLEVGIVPLTITAHQMAHTDSIGISLDDIHGDFYRFIENYGEYFSDEAQERILKNVEKSENEEKITIQNKSMLLLNEKLFGLEQNNVIEEMNEDF